MPSFLSEETVNTVQHSKTCHRKNGGSHTTGRGLRTDFLLGGVLLNRTEDLVVLGSFLYGRRRMNRYEHVRLLLCCHPCVVWRLCHGAQSQRQTSLSQAISQL